MNFLPAAVEEGQLELPFIGTPVTSELATRIGDRRLLVAGMRPEHYEDATLLDEAKRAKSISFEAPVDVTE